MIFSYNRTMDCDSSSSWWNVVCRPRFWGPRLHHCQVHYCVFSSPEHKVLMVSYCDRALSVVVRRPSCVVLKFFYLNIFSSETTHWILTKLNRNDPWMVPYQRCSNGSDWLHKKVTGSKNRFSKCNFQKSSCLKLQGPELSYMVYSII